MRESFRVSLDDMQTRVEKNIPAKKKTKKQETKDKTKSLSHKY